MGVDKFPVQPGIKAAAPCPIIVCCCVPRRKGGRPHAVEGLIRLFLCLWYAHSPTNGIPLMDYHHVYSKRYRSKYGGAANPPVSACRLRLAALPRARG